FRGQGLPIAFLPDDVDRAEHGDPPRILVWGWRDSVQPPHFPWIAGRSRDLDAIREEFPASSQKMS
ncbi:MAG: hypothetical protein ACKO23_16510, partial [Gemmataceae bacterium]